MYVAAILADSNKEAVTESSRKLLTKLKDSQFQARFEMRDVLNELSYQGKEPIWLREFLIERANASVSGKTKAAKD